MNYITLFNPDMFEELDGIFNRRFSLVGKASIRAENDADVLSLLMPGYKQKDLDITIDKETLTVKAQNEKVGKYNYSLTIGNAYDSNKIEAVLEDGILEIRLVKREGEKPKKVNIK